MTIYFSQMNLYNFQYSVVLSVLGWWVVLAGKSTFHAHRVFLSKETTLPLTTNLQAEDGCS